MRACPSLYVCVRPFRGFYPLQTTFCGTHAIAPVRIAFSSQLKMHFFPYSSVCSLTLFVRSVLFRFWFIVLFFIPFSLCTFYQKHTHTQTNSKPAYSHASVRGLILLFQSSSSSSSSPSGIIHTQTRTSGIKRSKTRR